MAEKADDIQGLTSHFRFDGAEDEIRTRDLLLGKEAFYH